MGRACVVIARVALLPLALLLLAACGAGGGEAEGEPPVVTGAYGEMDEAPFIAYERVSLERLPKGRLEAAGEIKLAKQARRIPAYQIRDTQRSAIRFTDDRGVGWIAWQPTVAFVAKREFAKAEGRSANEVVTLSVQWADWPDSCLGVAPTDGSGCTQEATRGFRVLLRLVSVSATYHTDLDERVLRAPG